MDFICKKCGSKMPSIKQVNQHTGLYCRDCGAWQKWVNKRTEVSEIQAYISEHIEANDNRAERNFYKRNGTTTIKCSNCNCLLHTSGMQIPQGQFNLLEAKFCPQCGAELI